MTFTDDDLKALREMIDGKDEFNPEKALSYGGLKALIARLEAAERLALLLWEKRDRNERPISLAEIEWRKAAGK